MRSLAVRTTFAILSALPVASFADDAPAAAAPAAAPEASPHTLTGNVGIFSQYIFRGLTQTNHQPALQGGFDYSHSSGFYLGTWGSNVSWFEQTNVNTSAAPVSLAQPGAAGGNFTANGANSNSLELDIYGGYKFSAGDFAFDVGLLQYWYPGDYNNLGGYYVKPNTLEGYGAVTWNVFTLKYSQSTGNAFGVAKSAGSGYIDLTANVPVGESGFSLVGHVGHQSYSGTSPAWAFSYGAGTTLKNSDLSYTDWKVGASKEWVGLTWLAYVTGTDAKGRITNHGTTAPVWENVYGKNVGQTTFTVGVQKTF